eukprot:647763-Rhodomonas_salina.1
MLRYCPTHTVLSWGFVLRTRYETPYGVCGTDLGYGPTGESTGAGHACADDHVYMYGTDLAYSPTNTLRNEKALALVMRVLMQDVNGFEAWFA